MYFLDIPAMTTRFIVNENRTRSVGVLRGLMVRYKDDRGLETCVCVGSRLRLAAVCFRR